MEKAWAEIAVDFENTLDSVYPKEEVQQLFLMVYEHIRAKKSIHYSVEKHLSLSPEEYLRINDILAELSLSKPIQHILGEAYFYGKTFEVSPHTLIPRPETEELVHLIIHDHKGKEDLKVIDIGTGTACIPISLALHLDGQFTAIEISKDAMEVARRNNAKYDTKINFIQADILEWEVFFPEELRFDIIVSNPPYITPKEMNEMHNNVLLHEPHTALFVEEEAPLLFYDYIADFALVHLETSGTLYFEINQYLGKETADLLIKEGFKDVQIIKDMYGADRIIKAKRP